MNKLKSIIKKIGIKTMIIIMGHPETSISTNTFTPWRKK